MSFPMIWTGYVGLVCDAPSARFEHQGRCIDEDPQRLDELAARMCARALIDLEIVTHERTAAELFPEFRGLGKSSDGFSMFWAV